MTMLADAPSRVTATQVTDAVLDGAWIVDIRTEPATAPAPDAPVGWSPGRTTSCCWPARPSARARTGWR